MGTRFTGAGHRIRTWARMGGPLAGGLFRGILPPAAALLAYSGVTACGFVGLDDDLYVHANPMVRGGLTVAGVRWALGAVHASTWQPLVWLSYMLDITLGGLDPAILHRTNLWLHVLTVMLFHRVARQLLGRPWPALAAALLLAVHPVHVESVAWIAGRKDVLSAPFGWGAILAHLAYVRHPSPGRRILSVALLCLGLTAKPMLMTIPGVLLILDVWPLRRLSAAGSSGWRTVLLEKLPMLVPVMMSLAVTVHAQTVGESILDLETIPAWGRVGNAAVSLWRYLGNLVWPFRLAVLYPHPGRWPWAVSASALAGLGIVAALIWRGRRRWPWGAAGAAWFLVTLAPVLGLLQFGWHAMADRFLYLPAPGLYLAVTAAAGALADRHPRQRPLMALAAGILALALVARTHDQVGLWRNSRVLFGHAVAVTRDNWMMHNGLGAALWREGRHEEAAPHFEEAIRIRPERPKAHFNLGNVRLMQGRWAEAIACYERSIALRPTVAARFNLAVARMRNGEAAAAEAAYRAVLAQTPRHIPAMLALADICRADGRVENAIILYRQALALDPGHADARAGLGAALLDDGHPVEALKTLVAVLRDHPDHAGAREAVRRAMRSPGPAGNGGAGGGAGPSPAQDGRTGR